MTYRLGRVAKSKSVFWLLLITERHVAGGLCK